jgi:hypothetical protein
VRGGVFFANSANEAIKTGQMGLCGTRFEHIGDEAGGRRPEREVVEWVEKAN